MSSFQPLLLAFTLALSAPAPELLRGYHLRQGPTGPVYARGWTDSQVEWVEGFLPKALATVEKRLGRRLGRPFTTVLVGGHRGLRDLVRGLGSGEPGEYTLGVAVPSKNLLIVRSEVLLAMRAENSAGVTLTHEVAHLVLHRRSNTRLPRWLDEGLAMWVSQWNLSRRDDAYLSLLARSGSLYRLESLETAFPRKHVETSVAYRESLLLVLFLVSRHREEGIYKLLDWLEDGQPPWEALERLTGSSKDALEAEFFSWVASRHSLLESVLLLLNVWTLAALLALVAIGRHVWKRRQALRRMEASELEDEDD